ncbi:MAG: ABC transporter ATP-binding protein, partial [Pseudomonadota bacterium]|nr:ABC transporter ATP-binding protein [Pseudomonadota bacterium]
ERQRVALAMLITQMPQLYLLDEPSNHLDVANQVHLLGHLQRRVSQLSASLLMATHDINLAARFCDNIVLLMKNGEYLSGPNQDILTEKNLSRAYDCPVRSISAEGFTLHYPY